MLKILLRLSLYRQNTPTSIGGELNATNAYVLPKYYMFGKSYDIINT